MAGHFRGHDLKPLGSPKEGGMDFVFVKNVVSFGINVQIFKNYQDECQISNLPGTPVVGSRLSLRGMRPECQASAR